MKRTDKPGVCSPGKFGWYKPTTPCLLSPVRIKIIFDFPFSIGNLSHGINGIPLQVIN